MTHESHPPPERPDWPPAGEPFGAEDSEAGWLPWRLRRFMRSDSDQSPREYAWPPRHRPHMPHERPHWWPAGEAWPPVQPRWHVMRGRFFRRVGCLFGVFALIVIVSMGLAVSTVARMLGITQPDGAVLFWTVPLGALVFAFTLATLAWVARSLRRTSAPIGDLLEAAGRVSEGDYSVRVDERGPAEVRALAQAFNVMTARLQSSDAQRRTVMADVTHELRTPLSVIQGNLEGMLDGVYPADEAGLKSLMDETRLLSRLIEDLRTLSLAESGALQLMLEPADVAALIRESLAAIRPQADEAGVTLTSAIAAAPLELELDATRIREVLSNLLSNALRHTPRGGSIRVDAQVQGHEADGAPHVVISVADTGTGIAPEDLPFVFDRFYKRDSNGMGLGLSIARRLVEAHGGTISAESPGGGATIRFTLPMEHPANY